MGAKGYEKGFEKGWGGKDAWGWEGKGADSWDKGWGKGGKTKAAANGHAAASDGADVILAAAQRLPPELAHPGSLGPIIAVGIPAGMVSGLIGKGGQGTK